MRRRAMETAGTPVSTFSLADIQSTQNHLTLPYTRRTLRFFSLRGEKRESSRNAQRSPPQRSNPRRTIRRSSYSQNATLFLSSQRKARKQPERSTFSLASFQSAQNLRCSPYSQNTTLFLSSRRKSAKAAGTLNVLPRRVPIHAKPPPLPILAERHAFSLFAEKKRESSRNAQRSPPPRSNPRRTIRRSLRLHYLTFHKRQGHAKKRQL